MKRIFSRRAFLKGSAAAAGGVALSKTVLLEAKGISAGGCTERPRSVWDGRDRDAGIGAAGHGNYDSRSRVRGGG